jgi:hypothetical protein
VLAKATNEMNADETFNGIAFVKAGDNITNRTSERRASARGAGIPDVLRIQHIDYVDPVSKVAGTKHIASIDYYELDANGVIVKSTTSINLTVPSTSSMTALTSQLATVRQFVAMTTAAHVRLEALVNGEL